MQEQMQIRVERWSKAMNDAATGPLVIAKEIVAIGSCWKLYKKEAGGLAFNAFLRKTLGGYTLGYFKKRALAVDLLDESARRYIDHHVAVWVCGCVDEAHMHEVKLMLHREYMANGDHPINLQKARPLVLAITGHQVRARSCAKCRALEERCRELESRLGDVSTAAE
jgi:hypothetical protein